MGPLGCLSGRLDGRSVGTPESATSSFPGGTGGTHLARMGSATEEVVHMTHRALEFADRDDGQGLVEYALILMLIALAAIVALVFFGGNLNGYIQMIGNSV
jgi:Flp pilus assembly pilin Flp